MEVDSLMRWMVLLNALPLLMACNRDPQPSGAMVERDLSSFFDDLGKGRIEVPGDGRPVDVEWFLDRPDGIERASLTLREEWFTDVIPPGGGKRSLQLVLQDGHLAWSAASADRYGPEPIRQNGRIELAAGRPHFVEQLQRLKEAGTLALPVELPKSDVPAFAGSRYELEVRIVGDGRKAEFRTKIPVGPLGDEAAGSGELFGLMLRERLGA